MLKIANLQQESTMLENQLDHQEEICDEIWAEKLAYDQSIEELLQERELLRQQMNIWSATETMPIPNIFISFSFVILVRQMASVHNTNLL